MVIAVPEFFDTVYRLRLRNTTLRRLLKRAWKCLLQTDPPQKVLHFVFPPGHGGRSGLRNAVGFFHVRWTVSKISVTNMGIRTWQGIKCLMFHTSHSHQTQQEAWTWGVEYIVDCADMLLVGSTCHIHLERLFYFTGTIEQGASGAAEMRETDAFSKREQQWCTDGQGPSRDHILQNFSYWNAR